MWLSISFPTCDHSPTRLLFQWSCSSSDGCDPVCVGRNSGEDCWCGRMAVTAAPAHNTDELVLPTLATLQWSSGISLQPAKREVHSPDCMIHGERQPPTAADDQSVSYSPISDFCSQQLKELGPQTSLADVTDLWFRSKFIFSKQCWKKHKFILCWP